MQLRTTSLTFALLFAIAAPACDATPPESFRDFDTGTGGGSESDTGGLDPSPGHICVSNLDGVTAERDDTYSCPPDHTHACWASDYPDPTTGAACCLIGAESDCFMNWGAATCPASHVRVCSVEALGNGGGDGDGDNAVPALCGDGGYAYRSYSGECDAGYVHLCWEGESAIGEWATVCCVEGVDSCRIATEGCIATENVACDIATDPFI